MTEPAPPTKPRRKLLRFLFRASLFLVAFLVAAVAVLYFWASSPSFESWIRSHLAEKIEDAVGGRVEIGTFHWRPLQLEAEAGGLVIRGLEAPGDAPFAQIDHARLRLSILNFFSPRVLLSDLEVARPGIHLIVYPDGSTNQPHPRKPQPSSEPAADTVFDLKARRVAIEQGSFDYDDRASEFDFQDRRMPFDFSAKDFSLHAAFASAASGHPESYHIEAGVHELSIVRGSGPKTERMQAYCQVTADLTRKALFVRSLRLTTQTGGNAGRPIEHALEISGSLEDFAHPSWQGRISGEVDLAVIEPLAGFPRTPEGVARLDLAGAGSGDQFHVDGSLHVENGSYIGNGVYATGFALDGQLHADPVQLLVNSGVLRFKQGGRMEGTIALSPWISPLPGSPSIEAQGPRSVVTAPGAPPAKPAQPADEGVPMNGKVITTMKGVALDTILDIVGRDSLQRVGFDTIMDGPATGTWSNGDDSTIVIGANLKLSPGSHPEPGEVPASGALDATYYDSTHSIDLRNLDLRAPSSQLQAQGKVGVHPISGPAAMNVDFQSHDLSDFNIFLRNIGLEREGKQGVAALPVALTGNATVHATWTGSLIDPRITGTAQASNISIETAPAPVDRSGQPRWVQWDSIEAEGGYTAERIDVANAKLRRGNTEIAVSGDLIAAPGATPPAPPPRRGRSRSPAAPSPEFDHDSTLRLRLSATNLSPDQLTPITGRELPVTGSIDAQLSLDGPIHALSGSGSAELKDGSVYGQPVARFRAQATLADQIVHVASLDLQQGAGTIHATGEINIDSKEFKLDSRGAGIELAQVAALHQHDVEATGKFNFALAGSGSFDDPRLNAHAAFSDLAWNGEPLGPLEITARAASHSVTYEATTRVETASMSLHGETALTGSYDTKAHLDFSEFNIAALLAIAHLQSLNGDSALAGSVTVEGPLAHPEQMRGDARLKDLAVTIAAVHLKSDAGLHASLANSRITLDPAHITGEETDLRMQGTLALTGQQQLDFATSGSINLKLGELLDPDLTASGTTTFQVEGHGPVKSPALRGRIDFQDGSMALEDVPNGLSQLRGTLEFNQDRLEVRSLTAISGGGQLSMAGYLAYQHGLYADLRVTGKGIRIRYPDGVSSLADGTFHLQGLQNALLLSGNVLITRFSVSPDLDIAALASQANAVQSVVSPDAPSNHVRLDIRITSSPQLNFQNTVAKLAGNVDLRLRGTAASPTLLGSVQITEGNALIAGTRYELQRGTVSFTNPVRVEPSIDLSATAHVSDYDITLGLHGTPSKMSVTYRSDPPLPEADVVALLALGRTGDQQRIYTQQQEQAGYNPATDALLGGALNATVSSRVQKLFGAGSVKIDPNYIGALGNSTSRIIVEEQVGRSLTLTYATNVDTTQQQLLQAEFAINRHVSLLVARDESGVFSMVIKATRRYR